MPQATHATVSKVSQSASDQVLLDGETYRAGLSIYNDSSAALYVRLGTAVATSDDFSIEIPAGYLWEQYALEYEAPIHGIWAGAGSGSARITEYHR